MKPMHIHLIAICGTGMGSLAGLLKAAGHTVSGSDQNTYPPMSTELIAMGVKLYEGYKPENLSIKPDLVIVGNAVSKDNPEVVELLKQNIPYQSMPQALGNFFLENKESIVVAGTHGKTTTSALLSHLLLELGSDPSFLVGGILQEGKPNYRVGQGRYFVVEGDEYDTAFFDKGPKFLHYRPYHTIVTSVEFDHADIYRDLDHLAGAFQALIEKINPAGCLIACAHYPRLMELVKFSKAAVETYALVGARFPRPGGETPPLQWTATNISYTQDTTDFDILHNNQKITRLVSPLAGEHNLLNTLAAFILLSRLGFTPEQFQKALSTFKGVKRRQEIRGTVNDIIVMDDFAHHPTAVSETIRAVKARYPKRKLWAVFEPRSNSSKRAVFQEDYTKAFGEADEVILANVFMPEKVKDAKVLDVQQVVNDVAKQGTPARNLATVDQIVDALTAEAKPGDLILVMSNGGFGGIHGKLLENLKNP